MGRPLIYCGSKLCSGRVRSGPNSNLKIPTYIHILISDGSGSKITNFSTFPSGSKKCHRVRSKNIWVKDWSASSLLQGKTMLWSVQGHTLILIPQSTYLRCQHLGFITSCPVNKRPGRALFLFNFLKSLTFILCLIHRTGHIKLADFGLSKFLQAEADDDPNYSSHMCLCSFADELQTISSNLQKTTRYFSK